jgi:hypothetical protein
MKLRITKLIHNVGELKNKNGKFTIEYIIQKKNFWGRWVEIMKTEIDPKRISHKTYEDAEAHMFETYMGHGICEQVGNEYEYTKYTYYI